MQVEWIQICICVGGIHAEKDVGSNGRCFQWQLPALIGVSFRVCFVAIIAAIIIIGSAIEVKQATMSTNEDMRRHECNNSNKMNAKCEPLARENLDWIFEYLVCFV